MDIEYGYVGEILKAEPQADGTLMVFGVASSPRTDLDGQQCDPEWLKSALPEWFSSGGNVREQHSSIAAGVGKTLEHADGDKWLLKTHVVDPTTIAKVNAGVLTGYSIGVRGGKVMRGKSASAPGGVIVGGKIVEVSLVDRPCNPDSKITICKAAPGSDVLEFAEADEVTEVIDDEVPAELIEQIKAAGPEITKGILDSLLHGPKDTKHKRDAHGKFSGTQAGPSLSQQRRALRRKHEMERAEARKHRQASDAEHLQDAQNAARAGRSQEAGEHRAKLGHYDKAAQADAVVSNELTVQEWKAGMDLLRRIQSGDLLMPDGITKAEREVYDESDDIARAKDIVAELAELIISEAEELANGRFEETTDLRQLIELVDGVIRFCRAEEVEGGVRGAYGDMADTLVHKAAGADGGPLLLWDDDDEVIEKRDFSAAQREDAADSGAAMPDGSFPIKNAGDLSNAIHLAGNAKDPAAARAHIRRRAKALGLADRIPDTWNKSALADALDEYGIDPATVVSAEIVKTMIIEATEAQRAELASYRAQLDEISRRPIPGGPIANTAIMKALMPAPAAQRHDPTMSPVHWETLASRPDLTPEVRQAYMAKAVEVREQG